MSDHLPRQELDEPRPTCAVPVGLSHHGESSDDEELPQVAVALFGDPAQPLLAAA